VERAMQHCSAEYIASVIEGSLDGNEVFLRTYNGKFCHSDTALGFCDHDIMSYDNVCKLTVVFV
jgi:hypothetical protein